VTQEIVSIRKNWKEQAMSLVHANVVDTQNCETRRIFITDSPSICMSLLRLVITPFVGAADHYASIDLEAATTDGNDIIAVQIGVCGQTIVYHGPYVS